MKTEQEIKERLDNLKNLVKLLNNSGGYMVHACEIDEAYDAMKILEWVLEVNNDNK